MYPQSLRAFNASFGGEIGHALKGFDVLGAAVRIAAVVERVHADENVLRPEDLSPGESEREKNCVAGGDVGDGDSRSKVFSQAVFWYVDIRSER